MTTGPTPTLPSLALEVNTAPLTANLNRNPSAVFGMARWTSAAAPNDVKASAQGFDFGAGSDAKSMTSDPYPIAPGQYVGAVYDLRRYGNSGARQLTVTATFRNAANAVLSTVTISDVIWNPPTEVTPWVGRPTPPTARQAPANAASVTITFSAATGGPLTFYVRGIGIGVAATAGDAMVGPRGTVWTSILSSGLRVETTNGVSVEGVDDVLQAGTLVVSLTDPALDPATSTTLRRGNELRLRRAGGAAIWTGVVENAETEYRKDGKVVISVVATDAARALANAIAPTLPGGTFTQQAAAACYAAGLGVRNVQGGYFDASTGIASREDNATAGAWLTRIVATHGGAVWIDADGIPRADAAPSTTPAAVFTDNPAEVGLKYTEINLAYGSRSLVNALAVKRINEDEDEAGGKTYGPYIAADSELTYGRVSAEVEVIAGSPSAIATRLLGLYSQPRRFPTEVTVNALDNLDLVLSLAAYSAVRVKRAGLFDGVVRIVRVEHSITPDSWFTTFYMKPLETTEPIDLIVPAAGADTGPGDVAGAAFPRLARRSRSATQAVGSGATVVVLWNQQLAAEGIAYDSATGRFTIPRAGRYAIFASLTYTPNASGARIVDIRRNGVTFDRDRRVGWASTDNVVKAGQVIRCSAGDTIDVTAVQNSGSTLNIETADQSTYVSIAYVGP